jgi:hypothetical protein
MKKAFAITFFLFIVACAPEPVPPLGAGFCLENPSVGIPAHCTSIQQIDSGDF